MANVVRLKRSSVAGKQPNISDLEVGELAVNLADGILYTKNTAGYIIIVGSSTTSDIAEGTNLYFSNARVVEALISGSNINIEPNGRISSNTVDIENVSSNIIPTLDSTFNLGSPDKRFKTLFLANNTIDLGGSLISSDGTGQISISGSGAVLPSGSRIDVGVRQEGIALVGDTGTVINVVPFYTQQLGLNTIATNLEFGANPDDFVFTNFTLSDGSKIRQPGIVQFYF
jgi:hypothetical protein